MGSILSEAIADSRISRNRLLDEYKSNSTDKSRVTVKNAFLVRSLESHCELLGCSRL